MVIYMWLAWVVGWAGGIAVGASRKIGTKLILGVISVSLYAFILVLALRGD